MKHLLILSISLLLSFSFYSCGRKEKDALIRPNILLITIDTLRRDHVSCYGYPRQTTPFIDSLAAKGLRFDKVVTPMPSTAPSHASILSSLHPLSHGVTSNAAVLHKNVQTIAEVYRGNGYHTVGAVAVKILSGGYRFSQGFDSFSDKWDPTESGNMKYQRTAASVNRDLFKQIEDYMTGKETSEKPLFIWVHYFDPHWAYLPHKDIAFKNRRPERNENQHILHYDQEIRYTDSHIEQLHKFLEQKGIAKHLITCITADHGEQFFEHGATYCHQDFYTETAMVPLILHGPGIPVNRVLDKTVSTMDIASTLLARSNLRFDYQVDGVDMLKRYFTDLEKEKKERNRRFLIMGNPNSTRSLQLFGYPYSFILNFDHHYRYWYAGDGTGTPLKNIDESLFSEFKDKHIRGTAERMELRFRQILKKGMNYMIIRADINNNKGVDLRLNIYPALHTQVIHLQERTKRLNIVYPVTTMDRVILYLEIDKTTTLKNIRSAVIPSAQLKKFHEWKQKLENNIFTKIGCPRKMQNKNEFYHLADDIGMTRNLIDEKKHKRTIVNYNKKIYYAFRFFYKKGNSIRKGKAPRGLTEEDKKILKSLGYLK